MSTTLGQGRLTHTATERMRSVVIEIANLPLRFWCDSSDFIELIKERYSGFLTSSGVPIGELEIEVTPGNRLATGGEDVLVVREGEQWLMERMDFRARWNVSTGQGRIRLVASIYSLDSVLRVLLTLVLAQKDGLLLHASSVIRDGSAVVFLGKSGAAKTKIAKLAPPDTFLLSDDVSCLIRRPNSFNAMGTPFYCGLGRSGESREAPVGTIYLAAHGRENKIEPVGGAAAVRGILENVLLFSQDPELSKSVFETSCEFVSRVPVKRLTFVPGTSIWDLVQ
jgi:hypothetical protein